MGRGCSLRDRKRANHAAGGPLGGRGGRARGPESREPLLHRAFRQIRQNEIGKSRRRLGGAWDPQRPAQSGGSRCWGLRTNLTTTDNPNKIIGLALAILSPYITDSFCYLVGFSYGQRSQITR